MYAKNYDSKKLHHGFSLWAKMIVFFFKKSYFWSKIFDANIITLAGKAFIRLMSNHHTFVSHMLFMIFYKLLYSWSWKLTVAACLTDLQEPVWSDAAGRESPRESWLVERLRGQACSRQPQGQVVMDSGGRRVWYWLCQ